MKLVDGLLVPIFKEPPHDCLAQENDSPVAVASQVPRTIEAYITAAQLARHYRRSRDRITLEEVRSFLHYPMTERKLAFSSCNQELAAIGFFYREVLSQKQFDLRVPAKRSGKLPEPLSRSEITRLLQACGNLRDRVLFDGLLRHGPAAKSSNSSRCRRHPHVAAVGPSASASRHTPPAVRPHGTSPDHHQRHDALYVPLSPIFRDGRRRTGQRVCAAGCRTCPPRHRTAQSPRPSQAALSDTSLPAPLCWPGNATLPGRSLI